MNLNRTPDLFNQQLSILNDLFDAAILPAVEILLTPVKYKGKGVELNLC
jgi:hypothetical protein